MADFPKPFPTPSSPAIASFNWTDIADNTGIRAFYLAQSTNSVDTEYTLSNSATTSDPKLWQKQNQGVSGTKTLNFDSTGFQNPQEIGGIVRFSFTHGTNNTTGSGTNNVQVKLYTYDGSSETQIGASATSPDAYTTADGVIRSNERLLQIEIPRTIIQRDEQLRVKVLITYTGAAGNVWQYLWTDPMNNTLDSGNTTAFTVFIPFKIDL